MNKEAISKWEEEKMRGMKNRAIAAAGASMFLALVKTNAEPKMWQVGIIAILMYEALILFLKTARSTERENRRRKYSRIRQQDARRWAEEWFNPYREVS